MKSEQESNISLTPKQEKILHKIFILAGERYGQYHEKDKPLMMLFAKVIGVSASYDEEHRTQPMAEALAGTLMYFSIPVTKPMDQRKLIWHKLSNMSESSNRYEKKLAKALMAKIEAVKKLRQRIERDEAVMSGISSRYSNYSHDINSFDSGPGLLDAISIIKTQTDEISARKRILSDFPWALTKQDIADYIDDDETILKIIDLLGQADITTGAAGVIGYIWDFIKRGRLTPLGVAVILISIVARVINNKTQKSLNDLRKEKNRRHDE